jgi:hypothetical protein
MSKLLAPVSANLLVTKQDMKEAFRQLTEPLKSHYSPGRSRLRIGGSGAGAAYSSAIAEMEGFSRVLWGLVPLLAGGEDDELWDTCLEGIRNGTDPEHVEYWGNVGDYDQRLVEMAVFGFALSVIPDRIWGPLNEREKSNLYSWLNQINSHLCHDCNWLFFNVLVNMGFRKAGLAYDKAQMERNLARIDEFYLDEGWYSDGVGGHSDYYVPFAIHYYALMYAKLMEEEEPERAARFKERASRFALDFIHWFSPDGSALPYGRSLTYRFAQSAFWSALVYAEVDTFPPGVLKGLILRNLRWWFAQPIFDAEGILSIGYAYPNLLMAENYNAPGSPYWAMKTFLVLALPDHHPFWREEECELPPLAGLSVQQPAHLVISREAATGHVAAFNSGHRTTNEHNHTSAKYEKFVYSTAFGFSVPRSEWGLSQGAFDSMLALSEQDNLFRVRRRSEESRIQDNVLYSRWKPWSNVEVQTWVVAGLPWHIRIHCIKTERSLDAAEGGFALGHQGDQRSENMDQGVQASSSQGRSGIINLLGYRSAELIYPSAYTNLLNSRSVIPTLRTSLEPGTHWLASAVLGQPGAGGEDQLASPLEQLGVKVLESGFEITTSTGQSIHIKR